MTERDLRALLRALGLAATADALDDLVARATKKRWGPIELLEQVVAIEEKDRTQRGLERRLKRSRLERFKPMADYDWNWPKKIDRPLVESVLRLEFLSEPRNVVLVAPQGLGKTTIAQNIAHHAAFNGHSVLFISAAQLLLDLGAQESARAPDFTAAHGELSDLRDFWGVRRLHSAMNFFGGRPVVQPWLRWPWQFRNLRIRERTATSRRTAACS